LGLMMLSRKGLI